MKKLLSIFFILVLTTAINAQYRWEFGGKMGAANYLGEIGGVDAARPFIMDLQLQKTRFGFGGFARYSFYDWLKVSSGIQYSFIQGADSLSQNPARFSRNLSFRNQIIELYGRGELHFLRIQDLGRTGRYLLGFGAWVHAGVGVFYHNPQALYQGQWVDLQPLRTEGVKYSRIQPHFPLGAGFQVTFARNHRFGIEANWNMTLTDYLDDASTVYLAPNRHSSELAAALADRSGEVNPNNPRFIGTSYYSEATASVPTQPGVRGNPDNNDSFLTLFLTYSYVIRGKSDFKRRKYDFVTGSAKKVRSRAKF